MSQHKQEYYKNEIVHSLADAIKRGGRSLQSVPGLLAKLISEDLWVERDVGGHVIQYKKDEFRKFVESPYPEGLDTTIATIERLCGDEPEIVDFLAAAKRGKVGRPPKVKGQTDAKGNVSENNLNQGNKKTGHDLVDHAYNRLRDDAPKLHKQVLAGELSPHAAMVKAGFRKRRLAVAMNDAQSAFKTITKNMEPDTLDGLIDLLIEWRNTELD